MSGVGGYQRPSTPAAVSGPGAMSQRTDGQPGETATQAARYISGMPYGENQQLTDIARAAPLAAAPAAPHAPAVPFDAPTQRPDEPITAGSDIGPGPDSSVIEDLNPAPPARDVAAELIRSAYRQYPSASLRVAVQRLEAEGR